MDLTTRHSKDGKVWMMGYDGSSKGLTWKKNPLNQQTTYTGAEEEQAIWQHRFESFEEGYSLDRLVQRLSPSSSENEKMKNLGNAKSC